MLCGKISHKTGQKCVFVCDVYLLPLTFALKLRNAFKLRKD